MSGRVLALVALAVTCLGSGCRRAHAGEDGALRVGFFPNINHAQALVGHAEGTFRQALGPTPLEARPFNAGPAAMEALLAGALDLAYVGSGPAVIAHVRSGGAVRVIAGSASGGAVLVTRHARTAKELSGKILAAPQVGNSQDVALRRWLCGEGLRPADLGGSVRVTALSNPEIVNLFRRGALEGAWVPEPWGTRLLREGGHILVDERDLWPDRQFPSTVLVATRRVIEERRPQVLAFLRAHVALTERARRDPAAFVQQTHDAFEGLTGKRLPDGVAEEAFTRIELTTDPMAAALAKAAKHARELAYLPHDRVGELVDETLLRELEAAAERR